MFSGCPLCQFTQPERRLRFQTIALWNPFLKSLLLQGCQHAAVMQNKCRAATGVFRLMQSRAFSLHDEDGHRGHLDEISHFKMGAYFISLHLTPM